MAAPAAATAAAGRPVNAVGSSERYAGPAARVRGSQRDGDSGCTELGGGGARGLTLGATTADAAADGGKAGVFIRPQPWRTQPNPRLAWGRRAECLWGRP